MLPHLSFVFNFFPSPTLCCLLLPLGLLLRFPRGIFPLPVSIITVQSTPDTYGHDITANGLPPKKQQTILCYMVRLVIFTHLLLTLLPGSYIDLHEVMWSRKFSIRQNMEIYRHLLRYFVARIPHDT